MAKCCLSPINVGTGKETLPGGTDFIKACMEADIPLNLDHNSGNPIGVSVAQLNCPKGTRVHSAAAFLPLQFQNQFRDKLTIVARTLCSRVLFESGKATGVELFQVGDSTKTASPRARKEVILTSGTIASPHILLLSGIGDKEQLHAHSIPVIANVPGVGSGLQE
jgi:choline dehydrogenase